MYNLVAYPDWMKAGPISCNRLHACCLMASGLRQGFPNSICLMIVSLIHDATKRGASKIFNKVKIAVSFDTPYGDELPA